MVELLPLNSLIISVMKSWIVLVYAWLAFLYQAESSLNTLHKDSANKFRALSAKLANEIGGFEIRSDFVSNDYLPLNPSGNKTGPYEGLVFKVAVYHQPPMVKIDDVRSI